MPFISSRRFLTRVSRVLAVLMLAVLLAWAFVYLQRTKSADANSQAPAPSTPQSTPAKPAEAGSAALNNGATGQLVQAGTPANAGNGGVALPPLKPMNETKASPAPAAPGGNAAAPAPAAKPYTPPAAGAPLPNADAVLAAAKAKLDAGDMLAVRQLLNDGICNGRFIGVAADQARALQATANNKLIFTPTPFAGDQYVEISRIEDSRGLTKIAAQHAVPWELLCRINGVSDRRIRVGQSLKTPFGPFHVVVSKTAYRMDLYLGGLPGEATAMYVTSLPVGLGKDDSTPTGLWSVVRGGKMKNPAWTNPRSGEHYEGYDPKNPLGGYWIALKGDEGNAVGQTSYGIHGTIEPDTIGRQASMGCVRLKVEDVQLVYDMLSEGKSRVLVVQ